MSNDDYPLILVIDDEQDIRELIKDILEDENYRVNIAANGVEAVENCNQQRPDLILLDIWMPDIDGISLLREFKQQDQSLTIVMMSGHGTIETAVEATRLGAIDFIEKPLSTAKLLRGVEQAVEQSQTIVSSSVAIEPVGKSAQLTLLREQSQRVAGHDMPILLRGEAGTGKHCFANYLHSQGKFSTGRLIELSAETFPLDSLKLSTLANGNTLFIDDIAQLSLDAQALLLHFLDSGRLKNGQLICASQHALEQAINKGSFLESLYYQINSITLSLPALRDHCEDIPELVQHFIDLQTTEEQLPYRHFTVAAQNRLRNYSWPGNILELKNLIQRLLILGDGDDIDAQDIEKVLEEMPLHNENVNDINYELPLREAREQFERIYLQQKLIETGGNVGQAAKLAGMERTHLYRKLRTLGIDSRQL